ncbi:MAG: type I phosphomannose isomerase catalytic subunit [Clostridia bacterium]
MIYKLIPTCKDYIWGGTKLKTEYGKVSDKDIIAETWELSCHKDGECFVEGENCTLTELIKNNLSFLGSACDKFDDFPVLIKLIDAKKDLSVQVHPSDEYALKNENQYGKTEMWYVVDCEINSYIYYGFKEDTDKVTFEKAIKNNTVCDLLNKVEVKKGDSFFIEAGTIHAIGAGVLIAEVQQNSNVTYRVYDYGRLGTDGLQRELHIEKACEVANYKKQEMKSSQNKHIADCKYFTTDKIVVADIYKSKPTNSFQCLLIISGNSKVISEENVIECKIGDTIFIPANINYNINSNCEVLLTYVK